MRNVLNLVQPEKAKAEMECAKGSSLDGYGDVEWRIMMMCKPENRSKLRELRKCARDKLKSSKSESESMRRSKMKVTIIES